MAAITSAVVGVGSKLLSARAQKKAGKKAVRRAEASAREEEEATRAEEAAQRETQLQQAIGAQEIAGVSALAAQQQQAGALSSAEQLRRAGLIGQQDIAESQRLAEERIRLGTEEAAGRFTPFVGAGEQAFGLAQEQILGGTPIGGGIGESIRDASTVDPRIFETSGLSPELARQASIIESQQTPAFRQQLFGAGQEGLQDISQVGGIRGRGLSRLSDIAGRAAGVRQAAFAPVQSGLEQFAGQAGQAGLSQLGQEGVGALAAGEIGRLSEDADLRRLQEARLAGRLEETQALKRAVGSKFKGQVFSGLAGLAGQFIK